MSTPLSAFAQGREHARLCRPLDDNPYRNRAGEGALYAEWQAGWQSQHEEQASMAPEAISSCEPIPNASDEHLRALRELRL